MARIVQESLSPADKYRNEWKDLISYAQADLDSLRNLAYLGELKTSKFRSVCWSLLLRVISDSPSNWADQKEQQRRKYKKLKEEFACNPHIEGAPNDDPLSQSKQSVWNQYFGDQELFSVIKQDVIRTFPGVDFFRKPFIREAMTNILFYYAREHPYMCYRQGMHEILAPILFVLHCDHQALQHFMEVSAQIDELLLKVLDSGNLEADAYCIFSRVMTSIESYYRIINMVPTTDGYFPVQTEPSDDDYSAMEVEVISQLNFIRDKILAKEDLHLHNHLLKLDIPLHLFGIRWLRLLFGREFPLQDLLLLWDAIFADSDRFELPNYILVAMLIRIRERLLLSDYTTCLTYLMRYPNNLDISLILRHALYMYMPKKYDRPSNAFVYVTLKSQVVPTNSNSIHSSTLPRQHSLKAVSKNPTNQNSIDKLEQRRRSSSLIVDGKLRSESLADARISELQYTNALTAARLANDEGYQGPDVAIIDGYRVDSPQVLRLELQNAQYIMTITRLKLKKYLAHLRNHVHLEELSQTLDGIEELCAFLDVKVPVATITMSHPVDQALEADEGCQTKDRKTSIKNIPSKGDRHIRKNSELAIDKKFSNISGSDSCQFESYKKENITDGTGSDQDFKQLPRKSGIRYEIPDNSFMSNHTQFFGALKDVELKIFKRQQLNLSDEELGGIPDPDPVGLREN